MEDLHERLLNSLREHHTSGLTLALRGEFESAHEDFAVVLNGIAKIAITPETYLPVAILQADSLRDDAFTSLRHGLRYSRPQLFERAAGGLQEAWDSTNTYLKQGGDYIIAAEATQTLFGALAKTEGLEARLHTSSLVYESQKLAVDLSQDERSRRLFFEFDAVDRTALQGNSAYAGASNAIHTARAEKITAASAAHVHERARRAVMFATIHESCPVPQNLDHSNCDIRNSWQPVSPSILLGA